MPIPRCRETIQGQGASSRASRAGPVERGTSGGCRGAAETRHRRGEARGGCLPAHLSARALSGGLAGGRERPDERADQPSRFLAEKKERRRDALAALIA